jgi:hypothetical protein
MPQRLLLEGRDIDELLLRVQAEHGPQARIVHAEQRLVGGVAGFFARRRYELSVQVDDEPQVATPVAGPAVSGPPGSRSFEDLLADADGADGGTECRPSERRPRARRLPEPEETAVRVSQPTGELELPVQRGRQLSTESPEFENLLSSLLDRAERPALSRRPDVGEPDIAAALAATTGVQRPSAWERVLVGRADRWADAPAEPCRTVAAPPSIDGDSTSPSLTALARLGLPASSLPGQAAADPRTALLDVLIGLPQPASSRLWGTTVVVGPADLAQRAVDAIAAHTGGTGADSLVASCSIPSAADLAVRASALCTTNGAALVVIETPPTRAAARRAGRLVSGLGLGTVVAAVDATRDVGATREWLAELGGAGRNVDQLAAFDVAESPTPLALLGLGPDVAWIDGRAATVGTWAAPCLDRLLADECAG